MPILNELNELDDELTYRYNIQIPLNKRSDSTATLTAAKAKEKSAYAKGNSLREFVKNVYAFINLVATENGDTECIFKSNDGFDDLDNEEFQWIIKNKLMSDGYEVDINNAHSWIYDMALDHEFPIDYIEMVVRW